MRRAVVRDAMAITGGIAANLADRARVARRALGAFDAIGQIGWAIRHDRRGKAVAVVVGTAHRRSGRAKIARAARCALDTGWHVVTSRQSKETAEYCQGRGPSGVKTFHHYRTFRRIGRFLSSIRTWGDLVPLLICV